MKGLLGFHVVIIKFCLINYFLKITVLKITIVNYKNWQSRLKTVVAPAITDTVIQITENRCVFRSEVIFKSKIFHSKRSGIDTVLYVGTKI